MGEITKIQWCDCTFNPWMGCVKVSPACDHCYAEADRKRRGQLLWGKSAPRQVTSEAYWKQPFRWNKQAAADGVRRRVFCGSLCDVMEDFSGQLIGGNGCQTELQDIRTWLYQIIQQTPNLDWLLTTKRPQNFKRFLPAEWLIRMPANVWGLTTIENGNHLWRMDALAEVPFVVRGISAEPLLGPLRITGYKGKLDWVIAGGESGPGARDCHLEFARDLRDQCRDIGASFFFKQAGAVASLDGRRLITIDPKGGNLSEIPEDLRIREVPRAS